ncbi:hypothetical protein CIL05_19845 [Virgibacillus profundi]|uniref:Uncharacterized protein n=1 Tax=Virgibacillus profundi TaxID=2024555 RepID=A0A2A2I829_9BACI|nr:hypothetical protein CIL05_19845 [Virgibacillus profundi]PXY51934.1 hypothetical protein CIT14_20210 [Virgibacillus profundi]
MLGFKVFNLSIDKIDQKNIIYLFIYSLTFSKFNLRCSAAFNLGIVLSGNKISSTNLMVLVGGS